MEDFKVSIYQLIGERIKKKRSELKINQSSLAKELKVSRSTISNIEVGRHQIPIHMLYRLSEILDTSANDFLPDIHEVKIKTAAIDFKEVLKETTSDEDRDFLKNIYDKL